MHFDRNFLINQLGTNNFEDVHVIHAVGDSMTPSIISGDLLFVNPGDKDITTGAIYVFLVGKDTMVKRVESNPLSKELTLLSDNKQYAPTQIQQTDRDKITVIGRVIVKSSLQNLPA
jgi:phage repressor protein C with HTH and peptisase S24 domain